MYFQCTKGKQKDLCQKHGILPVFKTQFFPTTCLQTCSLPRPHPSIFSFILEGKNLKRRYRPYLEGHWNTFFLPQYACPHFCAFMHDCFDSLDLKQHVSSGLNKKLISLICASYVSCDSEVSTDVVPAFLHQPWSSGRSYYRKFVLCTSKENCNS